LRCLVVQTAYLGDVILTVPMLRILRDDPRVSWVGVLTSPPGPELLRGQGLADEIIAYDKRGKERGPGPMGRVIEKLRGLDADCALVPHRSFRSALIAWLARIPTRVGFDESGGRPLLTNVVPYRSHLHEVERVAGLLEPLGIELPSGRLPFYLRVPDGADEAVGAELARSGVGERGFVVVAPGSRWATKMWPPESFAGAADELARRLGVETVLIGSSDDTAACERVRNVAGARTTDLCGRLTIGETIALADRAGLVLSNDSAAAHIAAAVGTPVVAVFGPTVPGQGFTPYSEASRIVQADLDCRPCGSHGGESCARGDLSCMTSVRVQDVVSAAEELLFRREERA
jgi:heptosyltransferase-2